MSDLIKRMKATLGMNVISKGSALFEYAIANSQFREAVKAMEELQSQLAAETARADGLQAKLELVRDAAECVCHDDECATMIGKPCNCYVADLEKALEDKP